MSVSPLPPLALYIHVPWCVRKCPYCDFNSHPLHGELPQRAYVDGVIAELEAGLPEVWGRPLRSIFFGGGTPGLLPVAAVERLLETVRALFRLDPQAEITLEANPGRADRERFAGYRDAGVNRLSLGIQSFDDACLRAIGRIHDAAQARCAIEAAIEAGFARLNLDLMYGLPGQTPALALRDLDQALAFGPEHLSRYQLTIEAHTAFAAAPPPLPDDESLWRMHRDGEERLQQAGYENYEISAWARPGGQSRHNLNYWHFGDYLGVGPGAHGKLSRRDADGELQIVRSRRTAHPAQWLRQVADDPRQSLHRLPELSEGERLSEYLMNALRLHAGFTDDAFEARTGLSSERLAAALQAPLRQGLVEHDGDRWRTTAQGRLFLDDLLVGMCSEHHEVDRGDRIQQVR